MDSGHNSNKLRALEISVLRDAGSPINAGSLLNAGIPRPTF